MGFVIIVAKQSLPADSFEKTKKEKKEGEAGEGKGKEGALKR